MRLSFNENTKEVCIEDGAVAGLKMQKIGFGLTFLSQAILLVDLDFDNITILDYASIEWTFVSPNQILAFSIIASDGKL